MVLESHSESKVILIDGECNLCNGFIQFLIKIGASQKFYYASLQSEIGQLLQQRHDIKLNEGDPQSIVFIDGSKAWIKSDAVLHIFRYVGGAWTILAWFRLAPQFLRNWFYDYVARHRYGWFGKSHTCLMPDEKLMTRML